MTPAAAGDRPGAAPEAAQRGPGGGILGAVDTGQRARPERKGLPEMDLTGASWRRASSSDDADEASVEIAFVDGSKEGSDQVIAMRDSRHPDGPVLIFTPDEWTAFTAGVQDGEFDLA